MKLRELKDLVDRAVATSQDHEDDEVMIAVKLPYTTVGAMPMVPVRSVQRGFDWEKGRFVIRAEENLTPADSDFSAQMRAMQDKLGWAEYENRGLKAEIRRLKKQTGVEETITKGETK